MRFLAIILFLCAALSFPEISRADAPATEFFAIETAKLMKAAPTDAALDALSSTQLSEISVAHGWYGGGLSIIFSTATFRIDARFGGSADFPGHGPASIGYDINASNDRTRWTILAEHGVATKQGRQWMTEQWRKQPITVILRFLNLKQ
jgi:hypothetical protein